MKKIIKIIFALVIAIFIVAVFYVMLRSFSWQEAYSAIKTLSWSSIIIFVGAILVICFVKAARFFIILRAGKVEVSLIKTVMIFIPSQIFTPLPGGEVGRALLFKNKLHVEMEQIATPVYLQALVELWAATFLIVFSVFFVNIGFGIWFFIGLFLLLAVLTVAIVMPKKIYSILYFFKNKGLRYKWIDKFGHLLDDSKQFIVKKNGILRWKLWLFIILLGILSHALAGGLIWYIAKLQGVQISVFQSMFAAGIAVLIQIILGFIPGGLGVTEGGLIGVFVAFGIQLKKSIIITLLFRIVMLPLLIIIGLVFLLLLYIPNIFKNKKTYV